MGGADQRPNRMCRQATAARKAARTYRDCDGLRGQQHRHAPTLGARSSRSDSMGLKAVSTVIIAERVSSPAGPTCVPNPPEIATCPDFESRLCYSLPRRADAFRLLPDRAGSRRRLRMPQVSTGGPYRNGAPVVCQLHGQPIASSASGPEQTYYLRVRADRFRRPDRGKIPFRSSSR